MLVPLSQLLHSVFRRGEDHEVTKRKRRYRLALPFQLQKWADQLDHSFQDHGQVLSDKFVPILLQIVLQVSIFTEGLHSVVLATRQFDVNLLQHVGIG